MFTLDYLEKVDVINESWRTYVALRAVGVMRHIARLRRFANLKPGRVADIVNVQADSLQERLDKILSK
jgi:hypothetical protein